MDVATIVLSVSTAIGGSGTVFLWWESHSAGRKTKRREEITAQLAPILADVKAVHDKLDNANEHTLTVVKAAVSEALSPVNDQLAVLNTKIDPLWKSLEALAVANAQLIHKPHPENADLDLLLDKYEGFVEGTGSFSADEEMRLRHYLNVIKKWEPGQDAGFYVAEGDPTRAAIVLATMELTRIRRKHQQEQSNE